MIHKYSFHLARSYARIFVHEYYLFLEANSLSWVFTNRYVQGQTSEHVLKIGEYHSVIPQFFAGEYSVTWRVQTNRAWAKILDGLKEYISVFRKKNSRNIGFHLPTQVSYSITNDLLIFSLFRLSHRWSPHRYIPLFISPRAVDKRQGGRR